MSKAEHKGLPLGLCRLVFIGLLLSASLYAADCPGYGGLFGCQIVGSDYQAMTGLGLQIGGGTFTTIGPGSSYATNSNDALTGGYYNVVVATTPASGTITLPQSLTSGTAYRFAVKGIGYDKCGTVTLTVGAVTSSSVKLEDRAPSGPSCTGSNGDNGYWTTFGTITPLSTTASATITVTQGTGVDNQVTLLALFITTNTNYVMMSDDTFANLTTPTDRDTTVSDTGNLVRNGSFEAGCDPGYWGLAQNRAQNPAAYCSTDVAHLGLRSFKISLNDTTGVTNWYSKPFLLKPNRQYTITGRLRTAGASVACFLVAENLFQPPSGYTAPAAIGGALTVTSSAWADFTATGYALAYPTALWNLHGQCNGSASNYVYMDSVGICEGTTCTYAEQNALEYTIATGKPGNVYFPTDNLVASLTVKNSSAASISKSLSYEVLDYALSTVASGTVSMTVGAGVLEQAYTVPVSTGGKTGSFTLRTWFANEDGTDSEVSYAIVPNFQTGTSGSSMCVHPTSDTWQMNGLSRLGFRWARALSPLGIFNMNSVEATEGVFDWTTTDAAVASLNSAGYTIIGTLFCTASGCPTYAKNGGGDPILAKWSTFVAAAVTRYKASVTYWEIENEPHQRSWWTGSSGAYDLYGQFTKTTIDAIRANDLNDSKTVCFGGVTSTYIGLVDAQMDSRYGAGYIEANCDYIAGHSYYGGNPPSGFPAIVSTYGKPVWNTEEGFYDRGSLTGPSSGFAPAGQSLYGYNYGARYYDGARGNVDASALQYLTSVANQMSNVCLYDGRNIGIDNKWPGYNGQSTSTLEFDGSIGAKGVSMSLAASFIDHATTSGDVCAASSTYCFLFTRADTTPVAALASADYLPRTITISGGSSCSLYDLMGNAVSFSGSAIPYGRSPVYLTCPVTTAALSAALAGGTIATRTDVTAPNVIIAEAPRGVVNASTRTVRFRWLAWDDISKPNLGETNLETVGAPPETANPDAILYQTCMDGVCSAYRQDVYTDYTVGQGAHTFTVKAKDAAGNVSGTITRTFEIGAVDPVTPPTPSAPRRLRLRKMTP